jgi:hypothetical protein
MRVWIGLKQHEQYVHEWVGEISNEDDVADAVKNAVADYQRASGQVVDKNSPPR